MTPDLNTIIEGAAETIRAISHIGDVSRKQGDRPTWLRVREAKQCFWIVTHTHSGVNPGPGGNSLNLRQRKIVIDGWMPWSVAERTAEAFRDKLNEVEWQLATHRGLGVCARMQGMPNTDLVRIEHYSGLQEGDLARLCHHARISFEVVHYHPVEGS
jgi:hypothetical protein